MWFICYSKTGHIWTLYIFYVCAKINSWSGLAESITSNREKHILAEIDSYISLGQNLKEGLGNRVIDFQIEI